MTSTLRNFTVFDLASRDGWVCQLCGVPIDREYKHPSPLAAVVMKAQGGQLAHLRCAGHQTRVEQHEANKKRIKTLTISEIRAIGVCLRCGAPVEKTTKNPKRWCSEVCRVRTMEILPAPPLIVLFVCDWCDSPSMGRRSQKFCSYRCGKKSASYLRNGRHRANNGAQAERISRSKVYARDGWVCQLCGLSVDPAVCYPEPLCASLDHKIPVSAGGEHTYDNVQLAHLQCNLKRGAGGLIERVAPDYNSYEPRPKMMLPAGTCLKCNTPIPSREARKFHFRIPKYCSRRCAAGGRRRLMTDLPLDHPVLQFRPLAVVAELIGVEYSTLRRYVEKKHVPVVLATSGKTMLCPASINRLRSDLAAGLLGKYVLLKRPACGATGRHNSKSCPVCYQALLVRMRSRVTCPKCRLRALPDVRCQCA